MLRFCVHYFLLFAVMATVTPYVQVFLRARGFSDAQVGYLQGLLALAGVLGPMAAGYVADRLNRRRAVLAGCLLVFALLLVPLNATSNFWLAAVLVAGIGFAVRPPIPLTDTLAAGGLPDPVHQYGRVRAWGSVGFVATLAVLSLLRLVDEKSSASMMRCMLVTAGLCLVSSLSLHEGHRQERTRPVSAGSGSAFDRTFGLVLAAMAMHQLGMAAYYSFFTIYLHDVVKMQNAAWVWAIGTAAETPMLFYAGRVIRRFGLQAMLIASMAAVSFRLGIYALVPVLWVILLSQLLHAMTFGLFHAASIEFLRRKVPAARRGLGMALYMSMAVALPTWIGSSVGGRVIEQWGYSALYLAYAAAPLVGIALLASAGRGLDAPHAPARQEALSGGSGAV